jgi:antitoxin HicB
MPNYNYTVIFQPAPEGGFNIEVPAIPEIVTYGGTIEEARRMAAGAIRRYVEVAIRLGEPIPPDVQPSTERVAVTIT